MANRRMISKTIKESKKVLRLYNNCGDKTFVEFALLLYTWLIPFTDEYGHMDGEPDVVKNTVMPFSERKSSEFDQALILLHQSDLIRLYLVNQERFLEIVNFEKFQTFKNDRKRVAEFPSPVDSGGFLKFPVDSIEQSAVQEVKLSEVKLSKEVSPNQWNPEESTNQNLTPKGSALPPSDEEIKTVEELADLTEKLYQTGKFKKAPVFVNKYQKEKKHPESILHALKRIRDRDEKKYPDPWSYGVSVIQVESGNYRERDQIKKHEQLKKEEMRE